jgi:hypothetical protein
MGIGARTAHWNEFLTGVPSTQLRPSADNIRNVKSADYNSVEYAYVIGPEVCSSSASFSALTWDVISCPAIGWK